MATAIALPSPGLKPIDLLANSREHGKLTSTKQTKARAAAQDFEAVFLNSMFQHMFTGIQRGRSLRRQRCRRRLALDAHRRIRKIVRKIGRNRHRGSGLSDADCKTRGKFMTAPGTGQTLNAAEAEQAVVSLEKIMDQLEQTVTEETARVRAGRLRDAMNLDGAKIECARLYALESERVKAAKDTIAKVAPALLDRLRQRHNIFQSLMRTNLTVLATAHAVSEGIIRGVSGELARKQAPSTYGATGRAQAPSTKVSPPLAISRSL